MLITLKGMSKSKKYSLSGLLFSLFLAVVSFSFYFSFRFYSDISLSGIFHQLLKDPVFIFFLIIPAAVSISAYIVGKKMDTLIRRSHRMLSEINEINEITKEINLAANFDTIFQKFYTYLSETYGFESCGVAMVTPDKKGYRFVKSSSPKNLSTLKNIFENKTVFPLDESGGTVARIICNNTHLFFTDIDPAKIDNEVNRKAVEASHLKSVLHIPIPIGNEAVGAVSLMTHTKFIYLTDEDINSIRRFMDQVAITMRNTRLYDEVREKNDELGEAINKVENMSSAISGITDEIQNLDSHVQNTVSVTKQILHQVNDIIHSVEQQSSLIDGSFSHSEDLLSGAERMNSIVMGKKGSLNQLMKMADAGISNMIQSTESIEKISKSTKDMYELIKIINNISDQTHLLAMNAAIEAAHAGSYGRGFAVVASEIRKLAEQTSRNAKSINDYLKSIVNNIVAADEINKTAKSSFNDIVIGISEAVHAMSDVSEEMTHVDITSKSISGIVSKLKQHASDVKGILESVASNADTINEKINSVSIISQQTVNNISKIHEEIAKISETVH